MPIRRASEKRKCAARGAGTTAANDFEASPRNECGTDAQHQARLEGVNDARTGVPHGIPRGAMCVQRFDDSLNSAIHITYRISLRSSSMPEPRDPLLKVLIHFEFLLRAVRNNVREGTTERVWLVPPAGAWFRGCDAPGA